MDISVPTANSCYTQLKPLNAKQCPLASNSHHSLSQKVAVSALILQQLFSSKKISRAVEVHDPEVEETLG